MSTPYPTVRHRCDFCRKSYASITTARKHEAVCWRNPATSSCPSCFHFQPEPFTDCALGLGSYSDPYGPNLDDDGRFEWVAHCPSWKARQ